MWYIAQGFGVIGMILAFLSFQGNTKKHVSLYQAASSMMFGIEYIFLTILGNDAVAGIALSFLGGFKCLICAFSTNPKNKWANINVWMPILLVAVVTASIITWSSWFCLFSFLGITLVTVAYWTKSARSVRVMYLIAAPCWMVYNVMTGNWPGVGTETFNLVSLMIAFIRFDILKQTEKKVN